MFKSRFRLCRHLKVREIKAICVGCVCPIAVSELVSYFEAIANPTHASGVLCRQTGRIVGRLHEHVSGIETTRRRTLAVQSSQDGMSHIKGFGSNSPGGISTNADFQFAKSDYKAADYFRFLWVSPKGWIDANLFGLCHG
jgi:hypothetical protein